MNECEIFMNVLDLDDEDERRSYLDQVCGDDSSLRQRVDLLLASHQQVGSLLEHPAAEGLGTQHFSGAEHSEGGADTTIMPQLGETSLD